MWILKYENTLDDGKVNKVSCCLKKSITYTIGRSSKCNFVTKNDKSISRQHLSLVWENDKISVQNFGKVTQIDDRHLNDRETTSFPPATDVSRSKVNKDRFISYEVHIGTTPIIVELIWISANWIIPCRIPNKLQILKDYGINVIEEEHLTTSLGCITNAFLDLPDGKMYKCYRDLFLFYNNIRTVSKGKLNDLLKWITEDIINFDNEWENKMGYYLFETRNKQENVDERLKRTIEGIQFCAIGHFDKVQLTYLSLTFSALGVVHVNINTIQKLEDFIKKSMNNNMPLILIRGSDFQDEPNNHILKSNYLINIDEVKRCLEDVSIKDNACTISELTALLHEDRTIDQHPPDNTYDDIHKKRLLEESKKEDIVEENPKPAKKRRIARPKVKPLNSLSFFVGGGDVMNQSKDDKTEGVTKPSTESNGVAKFSKVSNIQSVSDSSDNISKSTQVKEDPNQDILASPDQHLKEHNTITNKEVSGIYETATDTVAETPSHYDDLHNTTTKKNHGTKTSIQDQKSPIYHNEINTGDQDISDIQPQEQDCDKVGNGESKRLKERPRSLVDVIQSTKSKAIERLKTDIVEVRPDELTDSAINDFANLEIEENPSLIIHRDRSMVEQIRGPWHGRKNFKKFVKGYPSSRKNNDSVTNTALLITRSYVDTKPYDRTSKWKTNDGFDVGEAINNSPYTEDDSLEVVSRPKDMTTDRPVNNTIKDTLSDQRRKFIDKNEGSSDEESNSFSFSRSNNNTNGLFVSNDDDEEEEDINETNLVNHVQVSGSNGKHTDIADSSLVEGGNDNNKKLLRTSS
ncbi:hypothetical protein C6P45_000210 [Maudiozyma exigua]|uniref:FHA domain-containing protein n=1 Tax=Maudiozyma exigua TaxID=34358 RepID=A0A9P6W732_MAUEX|nr:hypothetical protein C6P45_000210 [Kazachstania exigua]